MWDALPRLVATPFVDAVNSEFPVNRYPDTGYFSGLLLDNVF